MQIQIFDGAAGLAQSLDQGGVKRGSVRGTMPARLRCPHYRPISIRFSKHKAAAKSEGVMLGNGVAILLWNATCCFTKEHLWSRLTALCVSLMQSVRHKFPLVNHMHRISFSSSISRVLSSNDRTLSPSFSPGQAMCGTRSRKNASAACTKSRC